MKNMQHNNELKVHFLNVNHGDATILEFPDDSTQNLARYGVVDFGAKRAEDRRITTDYMESLLRFRADNDPAFDFYIEFACVTHPHDDHYGGLTRFMNTFTDPDNPNQNKVNTFWDCGFRTNSLRYNQILEGVLNNPHITFSRLGSGSEFEFGPVRITILAPSVDLRNRFDTYGIGKNDASIVLKVKYRNSYIILAGDAEFASWGKTTEEYPRRERINFYTDSLGLSEREETSDQLKCDILRTSHHGSKHGTSLEYLERLKPNRVVISSGNSQWYQNNKPSWVNMFPHELTDKTLLVLEESLGSNVEIYHTGEQGNLIFKYNGDWTPRDVAKINERPGTQAFDLELTTKWS
jgi:beta-lactamase superfamily II metal-dependent hydrolase